MIETTARVSTSDAAEYVSRLCRLFGSDSDLHPREREGVIHFENAVATLTPRDGQLIVTILANDNETVEQLQSMVSNELHRCSPGTTSFSFNWSRTPSLNLDSVQG